MIPIDPAAKIPIMLEDVLRRIEQRLRALKLTETAASRLAGKPDAIRNIRRGVEEGRDGVSTKTLAALAPVLETTVSWLSEGAGPEHNPAVVPLLGYVGAGAETHLFAESQGPFETVRAPENVANVKAALEIRGESLGAFFDRWLVFYGERFDPPETALIGSLCVVGLEDGRVLVKKLTAGQQNGKFTLLSQFEPPIYDAVVLWAARVVAMSPR